MGRINVVCATQPGPNPGMASVDLAFQALCRRQRLAADVTFHQLYTGEEWHAAKPEAERSAILQRQALPFAYRCSRERPQEVWDANAIVFWGDFLHMEHYLKTSAARLAKLNFAADEAAGRRQALEYFFLTQAPAEVLKKALAFGGTLLFDRGLEQCGEDYAAAFNRFMGGARGVWMRDVYSALKVARARGAAGAPQLGTDCALLLRDEDMGALPRSAWTQDAERGRGGLGVFFGRSLVPLKALAGFAQDCSRRLGLKPHWIPWGTEHSFPLMGYQVNPPTAGGAPISEPPLLGDLFEFIRRYRVVITDTYHLCVNAWNLGVPAICVGHAVPRAPNNVNSGYAFAWRDKRHVFYAMNDALDFYVHAEELAAPQWRERRVAQLQERLEDKAGIAAIAGRVRAQAEAAETPVAGALRALLAAP